MLNKSAIVTQKENITDLKQLVLKSDEHVEGREAALTYCDACICACNIALQILEDEKKEVTPQTEPEKKEKKKKAVSKKTPESSASLEDKQETPKVSVEIDEDDMF